jgi:hypothetical protein
MKVGRDKTSYGTKDRCRVYRRRYGTEMAFCGVEESANLIRLRNVSDYALKTIRAETE